MTEVFSVDARTQQPTEAVAVESTAAEVATTCQQAAAAAAPLEAMHRTGRSRLLRQLADALDADRAVTVELADRETALGTTRLVGEMARTTYQLRLFADVLDEGSYLEATIDHAGSTPAGQRPDLRRMLVPVGPVAVYGSSNFPLAFSVAGGDTASALAAGCPVVVKAHPSHPATSIRVFHVLRAAAAAAGAPDGVLGLVHGYAAGRSLVCDPAIRAAAFTGSLSGGRALHDLAAGRPDPIPFYGEMTSVNPLVVTPAAAAERAEQIGQGLVDSFTLGAGQFCTKPGLVFLPVGPDGDRIRDAAAEHLAGKAAGVALNHGIGQAYATGVQRLRTIARLVAESQPGGALRGALFEIGEEDAADVATECFGPVCVLIRYSDEQALLATLRDLPGELTATIHAAADDSFASHVDSVLRRIAGRLIWNGYPTGVAVSWAMQHGGPWPATTSGHTSVGATAIRRFLRPMSWQSAPQSVLPAELRDTPVDIPRRVDGQLRLPG